VSRKAQLGDRAVGVLLAGEGSSAPVGATRRRRSVELHGGCCTKPRRRLIVVGWSNGSAKTDWRRPPKRRAVVVAKPVHEPRLSVSPTLGLCATASMDRGSQRVVAALSRMQQRDGRRSRVGGRSELVHCARETRCRRCARSGVGATVNSDRSPRRRGLENRWGLTFHRGFGSLPLRLKRHICRDGSVAGSLRRSWHPERRPRPMEAA
jgi:hypothetical protein